jgi:hypothetical protein
MPRYYFHVKEPDGIINDEEGIDFETLDEVKKEAVTAAREVVSDLVLSGGEIGDKAFVVEDETGETVLTYPFRLALEGSQDGAW